MTSTLKKIASNSYVVNATTIYTNEADSSPIHNGLVVVQNGIITCLGTCSVPDGSDVYSNDNLSWLLYIIISIIGIPGGVVIPGLIEAGGAPLGQQEIDAEPR
jgi:cytosine/adenosine deaminase-related metal-dependent hydrolase